MGIKLVLKLLLLLLAVFDIVPNPSLSDRSRVTLDLSNHPGLREPLQTLGWSNESRESKVFLKQF